MENLFSWQRLIADIPKMIPYLSVTFEMVLISTIFGSLLGLIVAFINIKKTPILHYINKIYISFMRGTPILVQLYLVLYGLPILIQPLIGGNIGREWDRIIFASIAFVLNMGAFFSVIFQSGIQAVNSGQLEAGLSVGLTEVQCFKRIILPQAIRVIIPPYGTAVVYLFQGTAIAFTVGVVDFMGRAKTIGSASGHVLEAYLLVVGVYIIMSFLIRVLFSKLENNVVYKAGE